MINREHPKVHDLSNAIMEIAEHKNGFHSGQVIRYENLVDVREIREHLHMSREDFSQSFGVSLSTLQEWEQGDCQPEGPAIMLLQLIRSRPEAVREACASHIRSRDHLRRSLR